MSVFRKKAWRGRGLSLQTRWKHAGFCSWSISEGKRSACFFFHISEGKRSACFCVRKIACERVRALRVEMYMYAPTLTYVSLHIHKMYVWVLVDTVVAAPVGLVRS